MKRIIIISILFVLFGILNVGASNTQFSFSPQTLTVNNEGGKFTVTIKQIPQTENATCYLYQIGEDINVQDTGGYMTGYNIKSTNEMVFTLKPRDTADNISGTINVTCYLTRTDAIEMRPIIGPIGSTDSQLPIGGNENNGDNDYHECVFYTFSVSYNYFALWGLFGGVIEEDDSWYESGVCPKRINSVSPAVCGQEGEIVYTWEKKVGNGSWTEIENSNYESHNPEVMGYQSVLYRRKATCGSYTEYSNTIEKRAMLNAGCIGLEYTDIFAVVSLTDTRSPSVANSQLFWESSTDLDNWTKIASGKLTLQVDKPTVTTYYRRAASSLDGKIVRYSNVVCYSRTNPVYISKKVATDRFGNSGIEDIMYYDGLGRPMQSVGVNAAASDADAVTSFTYDNNGRQAYDHLPISVTGNGGSFVRNIGYKADVYYKSLYSKNSSVYPYTKTEYEASPLNRVVRTYRPGAEYQADSCRFVSYSYALNDADEVRMLSVNNSNIMSVDGFYSKGELYKNTVVDEDGNSRITFTDVYGRTVLSRQWTQANGNIDTYYVYDKCDHLRWVISPEGSAQLVEGSVYPIDSDFANKYCYRYVYGSNGLVSERHIPGQDGPEMLYYNDVNRIDSLTTAASRSQGIYYTYKYDSFGRISRICAGYKPNPIKRSTPLPEIPIIALSIPYDTSVYNYDEYDYSGDFSNHEFIPVAGVVYDNDKYNNTVGQKTHEKIYEVFDLARVLNRNYLCRTYYYDVRKRIIQTVETDSGENMLRTSYLYDYVGNILTRYEQYIVGDVITDIRYDYTYDSRGRVTAENISINGESQTDVTNTYDTLGRLKLVMFGDKIKTQYSYNIQGWLTNKFVCRNIEFSPIQPLGLESVGGSLWPVGGMFEEHLRYFDPIDAAPSYSGNIAEMEWECCGGRSTRYAYAYTYDELGRMTNSDLHIRSNQGLIGYMDGERNIAYDRNGNITHFERGNSSSTLYTYDRTFFGNRMTNSDVQTTTTVLDRTGITTVVSDPLSTAFGYDSMGNITSIAGDEDLEIKYNLLNLPKEIKKSGEVVSKYTYLSDGRKVSSCDATGNGYMYLGTARFALENDVPTFESIPFSGGRIIKTTNGYEPQYYLTDHLGSTRMIVNKDGQTVEAKFDYTPFGVQITGASLPTNSTEYRFSGKELQNIPDSEIYDFGARQYFPKYAIWGSIDPLSETYYPITPYAYCANNPINLVDPNGKSYDWVHNLQTGEFEWMDDVVSPETTPNGYSYVGSNSDDILKSMNIYLEYQQLTDSIVGLDFIGGNDKAGCAGVISPVDIELTGNIAVSAEIGLDARKATTNNVGGLYFKGINVSGTMSQQSIVTSPDISSPANGVLQVTYGDRTYYKPLKVPESGIRSSTSTVTTAEIMIPAGAINQSGYFYEVKISASRLNQSGITSNVDFVWKVGRDYVLRQR